MILFNTTFHLDSSIEPDLLLWLREVVVASTIQACMSTPTLCRLIDNIEPGCSAFALQFFAESLSEAEAWRTETLTRLLSDMAERWGERALAFSTPMEVIAL